MMHTPVLLKEVLEIFDPRPGQIYIDATVNGGGHAAAILERIGSAGTLLGIDWDCGLIRRLQAPGSRFQGPNVRLVCGNYANIKEIAEKNKIKSADGILFDLGFSSYQIEESGRGFSLQKDEPLDMRYNPAENPVSASDIVNRWTKQKLEETIRRFGEERFYKRIADGIAKAREIKKIDSTAELALIIKRSVPAAYRSGRLHPATRTFQAIRITVNRELESLERALPDAVSLLTRGGKLAVISFHSLEDRIVKSFFNEEIKKGAVEAVSKKPIRATIAEIRLNPRSRSARLRAAIKIE